MVKQTECPSPYRFLNELLFAFYFAAGALEDELLAAISGGTGAPAAALAGKSAAGSLLLHPAIINPPNNIPNRVTLTNGLLRINITSFTSMVRSISTG
ncbi:MAG: hypothetical protein JWN98_118 [Abditibacteriota bacterium]|nr:hypothetical protein [Abditibacteriota bacterium]